MAMISCRTVPQVLTVLALMCGATLRAQMFGPRSIGRPLQRRAGPGMFSQVGSLQGNERFLRGNRSQADFVGAAQPEQQGFVGSEQARGVGTVVSSVAGLRERPDRSRAVNRPLGQPADDELYHPRLRIGFVTPQSDIIGLEKRLKDQLMESGRFGEGCRIEVSVVGRTAIVQGEVTSARERDLVELVALVEPGISRVQNHLRVVTLPAVPPPLPTAGEDDFRQ